MNKKVMRCLCGALCLMSSLAFAENAAFIPKNLTETRPIGLVLPLDSDWIENDPVTTKRRAERSWSRAEGSSGYAHKESFRYEQYPGMRPNPAQWGFAQMRSFMASCPEGNTSMLDLDTEEHGLTAFWVMACPAMPGTGAPETVFTKALAADNGVFHVLRHGWQATLDATTHERTLSAMRNVHLILKETQ